MASYVNKKNSSLRLLFPAVYQVRQTELGWEWIASSYEARVQLVIHQYRKLYIKKVANPTILFQNQWLNYTLYTL